MGDYLQAIKRPRMRVQKRLDAAPLDRIKRQTYEADVINTKIRIIEICYMCRYLVGKTLVAKLICQK